MIINSSFYKLNNTKHKHIVRILSLVAMVSITSYVFASNTSTGLYAKLQGGYGSSNWGNIKSISNIKVNGRESVVTNMSVGYAFNHSIDIGVGFLNSYKDAVLVGNVNGSNTSINTKALDISAGLTIPIASTDFEAYSRVGIGYLISNGLSTSTLSNISYTNSKVRNISMMYEFGVGYTITSDLLATISYLQINGSEKLDYNSSHQLTKYQPAFKNILLGVSYSF